jgi:large subunit ribosomal protein L13
MKTYSAKPGEVKQRWYVVDAEGEVLGRLATRIATVLRGKHKPQFTPHVDVGDFVIVVNAEKVALTGDKLAQKQYRHHSGYPGGLRSLWYEKLLEKHPERAVRRAVWGMLPKTTLGRQQLRKLKVYEGPGHPHAAQRPEPLPGQSAKLRPRADSKASEEG